jgi:hypothetical protein
VFILCASGGDSERSAASTEPPRTDQISATADAGLSGRVLARQLAGGFGTLRPSVAVPGLAGREGVAGTLLGPGVCGTTPA